MFLQVMNSVAEDLQEETILGGIHYPVINITTINRPWLGLWIWRWVIRKTWISVFQYFNQNNSHIILIHLVAYPNTILYNHVLYLCMGSIAAPLNILVLLRQPCTNEKNTIIIINVYCAIAFTVTKWVFCCFIATILFALWCTMLL